MNSVYYTTSLRGGTLTETSSQINILKKFFKVVYNDNLGLDLSEIDKHYKNDVDIYNDDL